MNIKGSKERGRKKGVERACDGTTLFPQVADEIDPGEAMNIDSIQDAGINFEHFTGKA